MITVVINGLLYKKIDPNATDDFGNPLFPQLKEPNVLRQGLIDALLMLQNERVKNVLRDYDYLDMGDLLDTKNNPNDPDNTEATAIYDWYVAYYTEIDNAISTIENTPDEQLLSIDVEELEKQAFNNAVSIKPLP